MLNGTNFIFCESDIWSLCLFFPVITINSKEVKTGGRRAPITQQCECESQLASDIHFTFTAVQFATRITVNKYKGIEVDVLWMHRINAKPKGGTRQKHLPWATEGQREWEDEFRNGNKFSLINILTVSTHTVSDFACDNWVIYVHQNYSAQKTYQQNVKWKRNIMK